MRPRWRVSEMGFGLFRFWHSVEKNYGLPAAKLVIGIGLARSGLVRILRLTSVPGSLAGARLTSPATA